MRAKLECLGLLRSFQGIYFPRTLGGTVGLHFIFMGELHQVVNGYMEVDKVLKVNVPAGCIGIRFQDQNVVSIKSSFTESVVGVDEYNYFTSRDGYRIKLISE